MSTPSTLGNVIDALLDFNKCGAELGFGTRSVIVIRHAQHGPWRGICLNDYVTLRLRLERIGFAPVSQNRIEECVCYVAMQNGEVV